MKTKRFSYCRKRKLSQEVRLFRKEILRKIIHFLGIGYIPLYIFIGKFYLIIFIIIALLIFLTLESLRKENYKVFPNFLLRDYEKTGTGAHIYFGFSALLITTLLPKEACFVGIIAASIGDGMSGIIKKLKIERFKFTSTLIMFLSSSL